MYIVHKSSSEIYHNISMAKYFLPVKSLWSMQAKYLIRLLERISCHESPKTRLNNILLFKYITRVKNSHKNDRKTIYVKLLKVRRKKTNWKITFRKFVLPPPPKKKKLLLLSKCHCVMYITREMGLLHYSQTDNLTYLEK